MNVIAILGSPRKNGYSAALMNEYIKGLKDKIKDIAVKEVFLYKQKIKPCKACVNVNLKVNHHVLRKLNQMFSKK